MKISDLKISKDSRRERKKFEAGRDIQPNPKSSRAAPRGGEHGFRKPIILHVIRAMGAKDCSQGHHWGWDRAFRGGAELAALGDKPANSVSQGDTAIDGEAVCPDEEVELFPTADHNPKRVM